MPIRTALFTRRMHFWLLLFWALVGMPATFLFLSRVPALFDVRVPEPVAVPVVVLCVASGVAAVYNLPLGTVLTRLLLCVAYIATMPFAVFLVVAGLACSHVHCH